jgi:hypothetical protein
MDQEIKLRVYADEHEPADIYLNSLKVMDEAGNVELNRTEVKTTVEPYYNIRLEKAIDETDSVIVDPNAITSNPQTEDFKFSILNYGNVPDTVSIRWVEHRASPNGIPGDWEHSLVQFIDDEGRSNSIEELEVPAYDKLLGIPGEVSVLVLINIPQVEEEGRFWIDIKATSSAPRSYISNLQREDFQVEANTTFQIQMVLPELEFDITKSTILMLDVYTSTYVKYLDQIHTIYDKDTIQIFVVIKNSGTATASDVKVEFSASLDNVPVSAEEVTISVKPGEEVNITFEFQTDEKGMYYFRVRIDPNNELLGDSPQDNTWNQYLSVKDSGKRPSDPRPPRDPDDEDDDVTYEKKKKPDDSNSLSEFFSNPSVMSVTITAVLVVLIIAFIIVIYMFTHRKRGRQPSPKSPPPIPPPDIMILEVDDSPYRSEDQPPPPDQPIFDFEVEPDESTEFVEFEILPPASAVEDETAIFGQDVVCPNCYETNPPDIGNCRYCDEILD